MAREIVECVPNFSEGRRKDVVDAIVNAIRSVPGTTLLDFEMDANHNRAVVTFIGDRNAVAEAAFRGAEKAVSLIDLTMHKGEHPRIGALDVCPFVPVSGITMEDCVAIARAVGERIARELKVPVYLYEEAASRPDRRALPDIRKGEFEGLREDIKTNPDRAPDFGPRQLHPTAGASVVGARAPLIAFNVNLGTEDVQVAKKIAQAIRESSGGLKYVRAKGFALRDRGIVQVSMNMINYKGTPLFRAYELIKAEAERYGVPVVGSEIVGLVPLEAVVDSAGFYLKLENFKVEQILETRLWE
ncbi:MAG TPA: glutamate formimidoyltransferase [Thermoplasmata archaeon]|nr:glutamate formimidoyltransferase [Thermoplasmata archaeon]